MKESDRPTVYRWEELTADRPMKMLERRRVIGEYAMLSEVLLEKGCLVPMHNHANEQFTHVLRGRLRFRIDGEWDPERRTFEVTAGQIVHFPANVPHEAEAVEETLVLDVFSPPSRTTGIDAHG